MRKNIGSMSVKELLLRVMLRIGPIRNISQRLVSLLVRRPASRARLNDLYLNLKGDEIALFQSLLAKAFSDSDPAVAPGKWRVDFGEQSLYMPLRPEKIWLDWDNAVSIAGHDREIKATYESLLRSPYRPRVFFDIGANYGTHSLIFLAHGVRVFSFEPNPNCCDEFRELCKLNGVKPEIIAEAVGDKIGNLELWFPERDTWLGSVVESTKQQLVTEHEVARLRVKVGTVDDFVARTGITPDTVKIDTEGNELNVLKGARETINKSRPILIFEANRLVNRDDLWGLLTELRYAVLTLPVDFTKGLIGLPQQQFRISDQANFIALPNQHECVRDSNSLR